MYSSRIKLFASLAALKTISCHDSSLSSKTEKGHAVPLLHFRIFVFGKLYKRPGRPDAGHQQHRGQPTEQYRFYPMPPYAVIPVRVIPYLIVADLQTGCCLVGHEQI